jgi:peptidyl-prolyl cis-trans isomerase D
MFDFVAKHKRLLQVVLMLTAIPFVFFGLESYTRTQGSANDVANVDGTPVSAREFAEELRRQQDRLRLVLGPQADLSLLDTPEMRLAIAESLVSQRLLTNEVAKARLTASKEEVVGMILAAPEFQEGGKFSAERYANYLRAAGLSDEGNVARLRQELPASRLAAAVNGSAFQSRTVAERMVALANERREVAEAFVSAEPFLARVKPDDAQLKAFYDGNAAMFKVPERVRAEYVLLSAEELGRAEAPTEAELKAAYDARASQLGVAEQRRASHILAGTKDEAERILSELRKSPQRFAELAKKHSQDTGSAEKGGDLGMNARGSLASKALEDAIFGLQPGQLGGPVQTEFGWHVVRLDAVQAGKTRSFEEMRAELAAEVAKAKGARKFAESAEAFNNLVYEQSDSLKPAAERFKLKIASTGWFTRQPSQEAGVLSHPKLLAALFSQDATRQKRNTDAVEVAPGVLVAARVLEHEPEKLRPFEEVRADVARIVARREAAALAKKEGEEKLAALAKGGDAGLRWGAPKTVSRREPQGLPQEAMRKVMAADAAKLPAHAGAARGEEGYVLYRVTRVIPAEVKPEERKAEFAGLDQQAGGEQLDAYVASLRARAKVELVKANLEKSN